MNCRGRAAKTVAPDDPTVWVRTPSVYSTLSLNQDRDAPRWSLQHRMNRHLGQGEASVYPTVAWKLPETFWTRGLQHRMNRRTVGVMRRSSCVSKSPTTTWRGGQPTPRKSIASIHPTLHFSVTVSQRLFGCLGLFIPPPLTHLMLLDCVEVQRSSRHLEDHIQSIWVLNCSSIDLHMLCVCA
jgi:hypothetical protein